jgi:S1-C subfamily serine protease
VTNAHVVEYASEILVQKYQSDDKVPASILRINTDCDVAVLTVEDPDFWHTRDAQDPEKRAVIQPFQFGLLPRLQDRVRVVGYPEFGSEISITQGVVSRIQLQEYAHSGVELLSVQTDSLINHGNSVSSLR